MRSVMLAGAAAAALAFSAGASHAANASQDSLLGAVVSTLHDMRNNQTFGPSRDLLRRARAVMIVPNLVKGGFVFGGEGGDGVLIEHRGDRWSEPAFYTLGGASFGLQIGLEKAHLIMFIMDDRALHALERSKFKFGAGAGLTVVTVGANAQGATAPNLSGDIIVWASTQGAYGGLTLSGSVLEPKRDWNDGFYGRPAPVRAILADEVHNPDTDRLRDALSDAEFAGNGSHRLYREGANDAGGTGRNENAGTYRSGQNEPPAGH